MLPFHLENSQASVRGCFGSFEGNLDTLSRFLFLLLPFSFSSCSAESTFIFLAGRGGESSDEIEMPPSKPQPLRVPRVSKPGLICNLDQWEGKSLPFLWDKPLLLSTLFHEGNAPSRAEV